MFFLKNCRFRSFQLSANQYFIVCMLIGFLCSYYLPFPQSDDLIVTCPEAENLISKDEYMLSDDFEPQIIAQRPMVKKPIKNFVRPRYFSTELGVKPDRLFLGIFTVQANIDSLATAFNKTSAHLANKIKFFIHADNVKTNFKLKNIVGFTDTRENYRPFHVLKYIADNYVEDYDFFFLIEDSAYLNAKQLTEQLNHISMSFDLYMGTHLDDPENDSGYCDLKAGIIFSSSVIKKIKAKLDSCVRSSNGNEHSINIGKCVKLATDIKECQSSWQGISISSYKLSNHKIYRDLHALKDDPNFNSATTVYPITSSDDLYILHAYFSRLQLEAVKSKINALELEAQNISNGTISNNILEVKWPLGVPTSNKPQYRHDIIVWTQLNLTHSFMGDQETNVKLLSKIEAKDIKKIVDRILQDVSKKNPELEYKTIESAYRKFDHVRGMDYRIHIQFNEKQTNKMIIKSFEVVKPISLIQIIQSPYVTESTRIAMIVPTFENKIEETIEFISRYEKICMSNKDGTILMLVLLYNSESSNKGESDVFYRLKNVALSTSKKFKSEDSRIAWVSIRLPTELNYNYQNKDEMLSSIYGNQEILSLAVTDLALKKIGLESLVMVFSNVVDFKNDFLNRVRMNTIQGFQIYSPIGFMEYPCHKTGLCHECENCDVAQSTGYYDRHNYDVISFYSRDYVDARKKLEQFVPIVRKDTDIINLLSRSYQDVHRIIDVFIKSQNAVHLLRAIEPTLRLGLGLQKFLQNHNENDILPKCEYQNTSMDYRCISLASKKQIGEAVVAYDDTIEEQNPDTIS